MFPLQVTEYPVREHSVPVHSTKPPPIQQLTLTVQEYDDSDCERASMLKRNTSDEIGFSEVQRTTIVIAAERMTTVAAEMINFVFI